MLSTRTILPVALVAALLGGSVGAFVMRPVKPDTSSATTTSQTTPATNTVPATTTAKTEQLLPATTDESSATDEATSGEQAAYRDGFAEGFRAARENSGTQQQVMSRLVSTQRSTAPAERVVYTPARRQSGRSASSSQQAYSDYGDQRRYEAQRRDRSFWSKHRDKLTVAAGTGAGAVIGGLIGGKRGAAIGALSGAGGSALYTYKLRKRNRRY